MRKEIGCRIKTTTCGGDGLLPLMALVCYLFSPGGPTTIRRGAGRPWTMVKEVLSTIPRAVTTQQNR